MSNFPVDKMTDVEIAFVSALKESSELDWATITERYNKKFNKDKNLDALKKAYSRFRDRLQSDSEYVRLLRQTASTKKNNSLNSKDLRKMIQEWENRDDILDAIKGAAKEINKISLKPVNVSKKYRKNKKKMTLELLISDVHVGKLTKDFNHEVLKRRLQQIATVVIKEMQRAAEHYKIDRFIMGFIGDLIESATMHGTESSKGCEFGNSRQIQECLTQLFHLLFLPIVREALALGATVDAVGVTGNHDRTEEHRTYNNPGEENVTYIIYKTMEEFTKLLGLKNVTWHIPPEPYLCLPIYSENCLWEHYDNAKGNTRIALEALLAKRITQLKRPIHFMRGGHFHDPAEFGIGKIITNGNVPGNDGYSTVLGFDCEPSQTLNFYIEREKSDSIKRLTCFYKRFLVQLD